MTGGGIATTAEQRRRVGSPEREKNRGDPCATTVWLSPSATAFSCLCELCLDTARVSGALFADALSSASVRGSVAVDTSLTVARCAAGHEIVLRRVERPPALARPADGQLQLG